jgi:phosphoglycolate phosphatase
VRLLLFDVDGTLITARGAGREALSQALRAVYGTDGPIDGYDFRGKTDPQIVHDLMRAAGVDEPILRARLPQVFDAYVSELEALVLNEARVQLLPGVGEVVRELGRQPETLVGLLTGNIERGARACGGRAVAVATGQHSAQELAACRPDLLFLDFTDMPAVLHALAGQ